MLRGILCVRVRDNMNNSCQSFVTEKNIFLQVRNKCYFALLHNQIVFIFDGKGSRKKSIFFSGPATKALPPSPHLFRSRVVAFLKFICFELPSNVSTTYHSINT